MHQARQIGAARNRFNEAESRGPARAGPRAKGESLKSSLIHLLYPGREANIDDVVAVGQSRGHRAQWERVGSRKSIISVD